MADTNPKSSSPSPSSETVTPLHDRWKFDTTQPNRLRSYTGSHDDRGHSEWINRTRIHPALYDLLAAIIADKDYPIGWKNMADAVRDALVHRLGDVMHLVEEGKRFEYEEMVRELDWLHEATKREHRQAWVLQACEAADRTANHYIQRNQPEIGAQKLRKWLKDLPSLQDFDHELEDPDADYIAVYLKGKIQELEDMIRNKFRRS